MEGLPVAPFMDRDKVTKPTAQIGFIKFVLIPMFETVAKVKQYAIARAQSFICTFVKWYPTINISLCVVCYMISTL